MFVRMRRALHISPEIAALSMSGSSVLVAFNALLRKTVRLDGAEGARA